MKLGILMAGTYGLSPFTDGRRVQIQKQADALERLGHEVVRINPWQAYRLEELDAVHVVEGSIGNFVGALNRIPGVRKWGISPFLDTVTSPFLYRMIRIAGTVDSRVMTYQGILYRQSQFCSLMVARNQDERRLLVKGLGVAEDKVKIVLNGVDRPEPADPDVARSAFNIQGDFALHISLYAEARKNVQRLIEATSRLRIPLVIAGTAPDGETKDAIHRAGSLAGNVRFLGQLSDTHRDSLYAACRIFCLPSLYEGTGLVALEAASHGAGIVITRRGGPPDYFANFAEYVDPLDVDNMTKGIERAWARGRDDAIKAHVLSTLSWENSAACLVKAYQGASNQA